MTNVRVTGDVKTALAAAKLLIASRNCFERVPYTGVIVQSEQEEVFELMA